MHLTKSSVSVWVTQVIDLSPAQSANRVTALLVAKESHTLDLKRISDKQGGKSLRDASQVKGSIWD